MATLIFEHDGWTVVTAAWAAASKDHTTTHVCYPWNDASGLRSLFPMGGTAVGVAQVNGAIFLVVELPADRAPISRPPVVNRRSPASGQSAPGGGASLTAGRAFASTSNACERPGGSTRAIDADVGCRATAPPPRSASRRPRAVAH
jgi:hypothetical protein